MSTPSKAVLPTSPVLDAEVWRDLWTMCDSRSPGFLLESVKHFSERSRACEEALDEAYANKDRRRLREAAHALAGSAAVIGAAQLHDRAAVLEINLDLPWDSVARVLGDVHAACDAARIALWDEVLM